MARNTKIHEHYADCVFWYDREAGPKRYRVSAGVTQGAWTDRVEHHVRTLTGSPDERARTEEHTEVFLLVDIHNSNRDYESCISPMDGSILIFLL